MKKPVCGTKFVFDQEADTCAPGSDLANTLEVEICDGGAGRYIAIKTDRWALDPEDVKPFLETLFWCFKQTRDIGGEDDE
jgi:hypothetical protein